VSLDKDNNNEIKVNKKRNSKYSLNISNQKKVIQYEPIKEDLNENSDQDNEVYVTNYKFDSSVNIQISESIDNYDNNDNNDNLNKTYHSIYEIKDDLDNQYDKNDE
jgi:hypothetical protein